MFAPWLKDFQKIETDLQNKKWFGVYSFVGAETYLVKKWVADLAKATEYSRIRWYGDEISAVQLQDECQSPGLFFSAGKILEIEHAQQIKDLEPLLPYFQMQKEATNPKTVVVMFFEKWDARKKIFKQLAKHTHVLHLEMIAERDRAPWIHFLGRQALGVEAAKIMVPKIESALLTLEPWSLGRVATEYQKLALLSDGEDPRGLLTVGPLHEIDQRFLRELDARAWQRARVCLSEVSWRHDSEAQIQMVGLLAWKVRQNYLPGHLLDELLKLDLAIKFEPKGAGLMAHWVRFLNACEVRT